MSLTPQHYDKISIPILTITGHYDGDQPGAITYYRNHMASKSPAKGRHYLIIGPWDHAGTRTPQAEFGGMKFGDASIVDLNKLHKEWWDWTMKKGRKPRFLKDRVAYYVMGAEKWKYAPTLEKTARRSIKFYLYSNGDANDVFRSGSLGKKPTEEAPPDSFTYDPLDKRPADLEQEEIKEYLTDQRYDLNLFGNGLVYHSEPFARDTEITGFVKFVAWMSLDVRDTDLNVRISEVMQDGKVISLTQDLMRARYRESFREEKLIIPGEINQYVFDQFTFFSRRITKGSRLSVGGLLSKHDLFREELQQRRRGRGGTARDARTAHVTLYHDTAHPSYLEVPVGL
jgi:putative CocE/NonD family hydrolase